MAEPDGVDSQRRCRPVWADNGSTQTPLPIQAPAHLCVSLLESPSRTENWLRAENRIAELDPEPDSRIGLPRAIVSRTCTGVRDAPQGRRQMAAQATGTQQTVLEVWLYILLVLV